MADRENLGRLVRAIWVLWASEQPDPKPSWLVGWDHIDDGQREVDRRIGEAVEQTTRDEVVATIRNSSGAGLNDFMYRRGLAPGARASEVLLAVAREIEDPGGTDG